MKKKFWNFDEIFKIFNQNKFKMKKRKSKIN